MSSSRLSELDVERPNYSWQKDSLNSPKSPTSQRAELDIINSDDAPQYHIFKQIFGGEFCAPVSSQLAQGIRVLHVSPSRLEWLKDTSETYPNSEYECIIIGNHVSRPDDLSDKIKYDFWNVNETILCPDSVFDYIYVESMIIHLRAEEWSNFLLELYRILKPGGYLELQEPDLWTGNMGPIGEVFATTMLFSFRARGVNTRVSRELAVHLDNAGFTNITKYHVSVPCGWGPPIGLAFGEHFKKKTEKMIPFIMKSLGWTRERVLEEYAKRSQEQIEYKSYINIHKAYAQKP